MKKYEFLLGCLILCSALFSWTAYAEEVSSFSFITKPQTVLPSTLSKEIKIQSQNKNGVLESVSETFDLNFNSTSPTGLFLGSTGKPVSRTMAKGTGNRTFYYKDSSIGDFVITVIAIGRDSKESFKVSQNITIGQVSVSTHVSKAVALNAQSIKSKEIINKKTTVSETSTSSLNNISTIEVFTAPTHRSFLVSIFSWPVRFFEFARRLFIEED